MTIQPFFYNENFYRKLALTMAIIRSTPSHLTPREYTKQLQSILRRHRLNEAIQLEQTRANVRSLQALSSISRPKRALDLFESHRYFLQSLSTISDELSMETQMLLIDTIKRVFQLMEENLRRITEESYQFLFKQLLHLIFNYDLIPTIREQSIQSLGHFIDQALIAVKHSSIQMLIEYIGRMMITWWGRQKGKNTIGRSIIQRLASLSLSPDGCPRQISPIP